MPKVVSQILPSLQELYPDSPESTPELSGALAPICAYNLHVICLGIFLVARLRLGGALLTCVRLDLFVLICLRSCALHCAAPKCTNI